MAFNRRSALTSRESGIEIRPGDVVFHHEEPARFPLHVGIYVGARQILSGPMQPLKVRGLPAHPTESNFLGDSDWGIPGSYTVEAIGRRRDNKTDPVLLSEVVHISRRQLFERPQIVARCEWDRADHVDVDYVHTIGDGIPVFVRGTCAQFVEFLYEQAGLELIGSIAESTEVWPRKETYAPGKRRRINPATQAHVFWSGKYGLRGPWDDRYGAYPDCLFGEPSEI